MGFYSNTLFPMFYDRFMANPYHEEKRKAFLIPAHGEVLEIGFGTGKNLPFYPDDVTKITTVDPNPGMNKQAQKRIAESTFNVECKQLGGESLPMDDNSFDCVVSGWTLCSIEDVENALKEIARVLKPSGKFLFLEHGLSDDENIQKWQHRLNPIQKKFADGCYLNKNIKAIIENAGLTITKLENYYMEQDPKTHGYMYQGIAVTSE